MRSLRAVSPVVATTLLIIIAVVTAVVLYMWVSGTVQQQPTQQTKLQEAIKIEGVKLDTENKEITNIYVRNIGNVKVTIQAAYAIDAETGKVLGANTNINTDVEPGEVANLNNVNLDYDDARAVIVKVVTKDGVEATYLLSIG